MNTANFVVVGVAAYIVFMLLGFHQVSEGYVGIYKRFGVLQKKLAEPGYHFSIPFIEKFIEIKITIQTD
jgi:regulator of protease activity HflC (stomatin/prohibitin superfamily)